MSRGVATSGSRRPALSKVAGRGSKGTGGALLPARMVETFAAMAAGKMPERAQKIGPRAATAPAVRPETGVPAVVRDEKVLAEIAHELGNFFHKLYYWSDYLKEKPARRTADSTAAQMLERTIRNLEDFLKISLDYFHPTQMSFTRMPVGELVEGLLFQVRSQLNGTQVTVSDIGSWKDSDADVLVDPSHLSYAFEIAVRQLTKQIGAESTVAVEIGRGARREGPGLEVEFHLRQPNEASPLFRTAEAGLEWAVAQKFVFLHGGELLERSEVPGEKELVLFLPLCR
jgi:signal transduction histidine kinase